MKPILSGLLLASLLSAGCITFPKGHHPWGHSAKQEAPVPERVTAPLPKAQPVDPDEVTESNLQSKVRQLEAEIHNDERGQD